MKRTLILFLVLSIIFCTRGFSQSKQSYPETKKVNVVDEYFGVKVPDPYRWLEDDNADDVKEWVTMQNEVTFTYLEKIPYRDKIKTRFEEIYDFPRYSAPVKRGKNYFFSKNDGLQNQAVLYIQKDPDSEAEVFLDPNKFSEDGTVSLTTYAVSNDGKYFAYGTSGAGSDWNEFFVMDIESREKLSDHLKWIKFSGIRWKDDGFYYSRFPEPGPGDELKSRNENMKVYYHKLGTSQNDDVLIYEESEYPSRLISGGTTDDERFLIISITEGGNKNALKVKDLKENDSDFITIVNNFNNSYTLIDNIDDKLLIRTDKDAPKYRLVLVDPKNPSEENWKTILPEKKDVLRSVSVIGGKLAAIYLQDVSSRIYLYETDGTLIDEVKLPALGTVLTISSNNDDSIGFYTFTSFTYPNVIYKLDVVTRESAVYREPTFDFDFSDYVTEQVFYPGKDGTKITKFIKKELR